MPAGAARSGVGSDRSRNSTHPRLRERIRLLKRNFRWFLSSYGLLTAFRQPIAVRPRRGSA